MVGDTNYFKICLKMFKLVIYLYIMVYYYKNNFNNEKEVNYMWIVQVTTISDVDLRYHYYPDVVGPFSSEQSAENWAIEKSEEDKTKDFQISKLIKPYQKGE